MLMTNPCRAGVWDVTPLTGLVTDWSNNPALLYVEHEAQARAAAVFEAPTTYTGDALDLTLAPRVRLSDGGGYSSVISNYQRFDAKGDFYADRDVLTASANYSRDSSLYYDYTLNGSAGVERNSIKGDLTWTRHLTERCDFDIDVDSSKVRYGRPDQGSATLTDYSYSVLSSDVTWLESERNKFTFSPSASLYKSLNGQTKSTEGSLQLGFTRQLTELWTFNALMGYSRSYNRLDIEESFLVLTSQGPVIETIPFDLKSTQNGTVFSAILSRNAPTWRFTALASRQLVPSGFAFLSHQDAYEADLIYPRNERLTFNAQARYVRSQDPSFQGQYTSRIVRFITAGTTWRWTENWSISLNAVRAAEDISSIHVSPATTEVSLQLARQFNPIRF
jgi:hypothetical protein